MAAHQVRSVPQVPSEPTHVSRLSRRSLVLLALGGVACSGGGGLTGPTSSVPVASFDYSQRPNPPAPFGEYGEAAVRTADGGIVVNGVIVTPSGCSELGADVIRGGSTIRVTIVARALPVLCLGVIGTFEYAVNVDAIQAGRYTVEVNHAYENTGAPRSVTVHRMSIVVP